MPSADRAVAAILLAAGRSTRMGAANKLLADVSGQPMVRRVAEVALASRARPVIAVLGHQGAAVRAALDGLDVVCVDNPDFAAGLSTSLQAGLRVLPADCAGALILLGDMPLITSAHLDQLIAAFAAREAIIVPTHQGQRGNPVLWPVRYVPDLLRLEGDAGARHLLATHAATVHEVDLGTEAIFADIDTPAALSDLSSRNLAPAKAPGPKGVQ